VVDQRLRHLIVGREGGDRICQLASPKGRAAE
jgi:hypothetical protein